MNKIFKKRQVYSDFTLRTSKAEPPIIYAHVAAVVSAGYYLALALAYRSCIPVASPFSHIMTGLGMAFSAMLALFGLYKHLKPIVKYIPLIASGVIFLAANPKTVYGGLLGIINYHLQEWNYHYDDGKALFKSALITQTGIDVLTVIIALCTVTVVYILMEKRNTWGIFIITTVAFLPSLILGRFNAVAFSVAVTALFAIVMEKMQSADIIRRVGWVLLILVVTVGFSHTVSNTHTELIDQFKENQKNIVNTIRFGTDSLPQGDLSKADKLLDGTENRLIVTSEFGRDFYFKGYVGANYKDGKWVPLKNSAYGSGQSSILNWLEGKEFSPVFQYSNYLQYGTDRFETNQISVKNVGARRNYIYTPYSTNAFKKAAVYENKDNNLKSSAAFGTKEYSFSEQSDRRPSELFTLGSWYLNASTAGEKEYVKDETVYRNFVYKNYLTPNEDCKDTVYGIFWKDADKEDSDSLLSAISHIRKVAEENYTYTEFPNYVENCNDPLIGFLTEHGEGNSILYTSAAVEALKIAGYPARYVEGYYMENGTSLHEEVILTTKNSHSWAEVYMDGIGWLPIDFTPGFYYDTYSLISLVNMPQESKRVNKGNKKGKDDVNISKNADENGNKKSEEEKKKDIYTAIGIFVAVFILCGAVLLIIEIFRYTKLNLIRKRFEKANEINQQKMLCKIIVQMLELDSIKITLGKNCKQTADAVNLKHSDISQNEFKRCYEIMEKFKYGEELLEPYEKQMLINFCEKYAQVIEKNQIKRMHTLSKIKTK